MARGSSLPAPSPMVSGLKKARVKLRLWRRILRLALQGPGGPAQAARRLRAMRAYRRTFRGDAITRKYVRGGDRHFWDLYAPGFPSIAFDRYVRGELGRARASQPLGAPQTVILAITRTCPLRCEHCCEWDALNQPEAVSEDDWCLIASELRALGTTQFFLSGGEPLRRLALVREILRRVGDASDVWLLSSGVGLGTNVALQLRSDGLTGVVLSLDHWQAEAHDAFRGFPGAFESVRRAAAAARAAGLVVGLAVVAGEPFASADSLGRYRELAIELGAGFIQILEPRSVGRYVDRDVALSPAARGVLERFAHETTFEARHARAPVVAYPDQARRIAGCVGAQRYAYVDTAGALHPCPFCRGSRGLDLLGLGIPRALETLRSTGCTRPSDPSHPNAEAKHVRASPSLPVL